MARRQRFETSKPKKPTFRGYEEGMHRDNNEADPVVYDTRAPGDFVVSGPLYPARGPGRVFMAARHALAWAKRKYGESAVKLLPESEKDNAVRWAILVKKSRL